MRPRSAIFILLVSLISTSLVSCSKTDVTDKGILPFVERVSLSGIEPNIGKGGDEVRITGSGFEPCPLKVFFGSDEALVLTCSEEEVHVIVPASATGGNVDVRLEDPNLESVTFSQAFSYTSTSNCLNGPTINSVSPAAGTVGDTIAVSGSNFVAELGQSSIISIGGEQANLAGIVSTSLITVSVPNLDSACSRTICAFDVVLANPDGCSDTVVGGFSYIRSDTDGDGLADIEEIGCLSDPLKPDTDGDGLNDFEECKTHHSDPRRVDSDSDGLRDYDEVTIWLTDLVDPDTDCDMVEDGDEAYPLDPTAPSTDPVVAQPHVVWGGNGCSNQGDGDIGFPASQLNLRSSDIVRECRVLKIIVNGYSAVSTCAHWTLGDNVLYWLGVSGCVKSQTNVEYGNPHPDLFIPSGVTSFGLDIWREDYSYLCSVSVLYERAR